MKIKCTYCDSYINDTNENCPNCGAVNDQLKRVVDGTPRTIAELDLWYRARNLPPAETTRFFIGVDYKGRRAFGIYEEQGQFIVYKNKDDGTRAIRYQGTDEAYAVNELYLKLKSEILNQKAANVNSGRVPVRRVPLRKENFGKRVLRRLRDMAVFFAGLIGFCLMAEYPVIGKIVLSLVISFVATIIIWCFVDAASGKKSPKKKRALLMIPIGIAIFAGVFAIAVNVGRVRYYQYNDQIYCTYHGDYYLYDSYYGDYDYVEDIYVPYTLTENPDAYYWEEESSIWGSSDSITSFEDSDYYSTYIDTGSDSDSNSSYDWDSGSSWDSGGTDWGSDW